MEPMSGHLPEAAQKQRRGCRLRPVFPRPMTTDPRGPLLDRAALRRPPKQPLFCNKLGGWTLPGYLGDRAVCQAGRNSVGTSCEPDRTACHSTHIRPQFSLSTHLGPQQG